MKFADVCVYTFYFILNVFTYFTLINLANDFYSRFSIIFHVVFNVNAIVAYYLIINLRKDPGIITKNDNNFSNLSIQTELEAITNIDNINIKTKTENNPNDTLINSLKDKEIDLYQFFHNYCEICNVVIVKNL
jgi:hypothetical protein